MTDLEVHRGTITTVPELPGLATLYARAITTAGRIAAERHLPGTRERELVLPDTTLRIAGVPTDGPEHVRRLTEYQRLVHEPGSDVLPAGYLHILGFPLATALMVRDDFPLPLPGLVHVANSAEVRHPVRLGDRLTVLANAANLRPHRRGAQLDLIVEISIERNPTDGGHNQPASTMAYRGVSTYLARGVELPAARRSVHADAEGAEAVAGGAAADNNAARSELPADFQPPLPTARWALPAHVGRAYAVVSGDRNPIHTSLLGAKAFGFPRAIAHGMYTAARALAEVGTARGVCYDWDVRFGKPVLLPGTVNIAITADPTGFTYAGWNRDGRLFFSGAVTPRD